MTNVPKPDLERGAYIVYTDEPGEVLSPGSTGGDGNVVVIEGIATDSSMEMQASYSDLYEHFNNGKVCFLHFANYQFGNYGLMHISGISVHDTFSAYVIWPFTGDTPTTFEFEADTATENLAITMGD